MTSAGVCEYLEWDSQFFGVRIARALATRLDEKLAAELQLWCSAERIECLYFLADSSDQRTAMLAQEIGFRFVDVKVTLVGAGVDVDSGEHGAAFTVRRAEDSDIPALRAIARNAHRDSRFYYDGHFPREKCDELYETWIEKSVRGWAAHAMVADGGGGPEGYLTCNLRQGGEGEIGLVGVAEAARGRGVGTRLVTHSLQWFARNKAKTVSVVTQGRNVSAQRLYQKCGFVSQSVGIWFHRWFTEERKYK